MDVDFINLHSYSLFQLAPADSYRHDIIMETRCLTYSLVIQRRHIDTYALLT